MTKLEEVKKAIRFLTRYDYERHGNDVAWVESVLDKAARAAIEAMREPSEAMIDGAENSGAFDNDVFRVSRSTVAYALSSAIDAILSEGEGDSTWYIGIEKPMP